MTARLTAHQAKFYAHQLERSYASDHVGKLAGLLFDAQVDPKPHQIDAALFALQTSSSPGVILADEVGLGKTIEAGIVLCQYWAERKRRILVVAPSSLRQQWKQELVEKFAIPAKLLDANSKAELLKPAQLMASDVLICSYEFVLRNVEDLSRNWDLIVADEAHRLRSHWKGDAKIAQAVSEVMSSASKSLLLTATPLQNRLEELYGLVSVFDPEFFHSIEGFRERYVDHPEDFGNDDLASRISHLAKRTLRSDAQRYIRFTERMPLTFGFMPSAEERDLYDKVNDYLQRPELYAFAKSQRHLSALILRKRLGSSTYAVASTLERIANRLENELHAGMRRSNSGALIDDDLTYDEIEASEAAQLVPPIEVQDEVAADMRREGLAEVDELRAYADLAKSIQVNQKAVKLLEALDQGFAKLAELGAPQKAIIFTESTKTQEYLAANLREAGWGDGLVLFNGTNNSPESNAIYHAWLQTNEDSDLITGIPSADRRKSLVDEFRERGTIMIATEAASEGINLQFCSMLVNYDLPWNPQRVEQRIGRVHRYGQQHNVIVVNFSNKGNVAEDRILELLSEKFNLFKSVFGASDEVLGTIEDGLDFEKMIAGILERCKTATEINCAFDEVERQYEAEISAEMQSARARIFDNLDPNVQDKLRTYDAQQEVVLNSFERLLLQVTRRELDAYAQFEDSGLNFVLCTAPADGIPKGRYFFKSKPVQGAHQYRYGSELGRFVIKSALGAETPVRTLCFSVGRSDRAAAAVSNLVGERGVLTVELLTFATQVGGDLSEESYLLAAGVTESGKELDAELVEQLFDLACVRVGEAQDIDLEKVRPHLDVQAKRFRKEVQDRTAQYSIEQGDLVESRLRDHTAKYEAEVRKINKDEDEARSRERRARDLSERLSLRKEAQRLARRAESLYDDYKVERDRLRQKADDYIGMIEQALMASDRREHVLSVRWQVES
ncbi:SNF2-related protein [Brevibacterium linens]|uniref:SNF2-related protein n=1 Tax=Brevibacterium linens TaxID=1703 RepID=UPI000FC9D323|nr:SNF2-related protein [Brevibacterium linens]AZU01150.1 DNA helicase [Brevibacterium linens]